MSDSFGPEISALLDVERARPGPGPRTRDRVLARVETYAAAHSPSGPAPRLRPPSSAGAAFLRPVLAFGVLLGAAAWVATRSTGPLAPPAATEPRAPAENPAIAEPPPVAPSAIPIDPNAASGRGVAATSANGPRATAPASTLPEERAILDRARARLLSGEPAAALAAVEEHARLYHHGVLAEERDALRVEALVAAGRYDPARAAAARFHVAHPGSMLAPAVDDAVRTIP